MSQHPKSPSSPAFKTTALLGDISGPSYTDALAIAAAIIAPLLLYAFTAPRTVVLEDDGWFLVVGKFLGVGHPPGYPVHTLILNLFLKIPWGSTAFLGHLLSGIFGALACGAVYVCARLLGAAAVFALIGALLFAVSEHFWAQAIITEVYTLNALFFFGIFALLLYLRRRPSDGRAWTAAAFLYGLSLANHWPLMVLASPGLLLAVVPVWRNMLMRWPKLAGAFLLGVVPPYAWMVLRSLQEPEFSFAGPLRTVGDVTGHIARSAYSGVDSSPSAGWVDKFQYLGWLGNEFVWQLTVPGFLLALVGLVVFLKLHRWRMVGTAKIEDLLDWAGRCAGPAAFVGSSVVLVWQLGFDFDYFNVQVFRPYSLVCYGLLGAWAAMGLTYAMSLTGQRLPWPRPRLVFGAAAAFGLALVAWSLSAHWDTNNRAGGDLAKRHADMVFEILPPDAVLMIARDKTFPLAYYHFVEGRRPDVRIVHADGRLFRDNVYPSLIHTTLEVQRQVLRNFLSDTSRPVFYTGRSPKVKHDRIRDYGFLREIRGPEVGNTATVEFRPTEAAEVFFASLFEGEYHRMELVERNYYVGDYSEYLGIPLTAPMSDDSKKLLERTDPLRELALRDYYGLIYMAGVLANYGNAKHLEQALEWLEMAEPLIGAAIRKRYEAELYTNMGTVRWHQGQKEEAMPFFEKALAIWPHPDNRAIKYLDGWR